MQIAQGTLKENKIIKATYKFLGTRENQKQKLREKGNITYYVQSKKETAIQFHHKLYNKGKEQHL